jgi:hypothetical protein
MNRPLLVWEDTGPGSRRLLFRLFGVRWEATRYAWLGPFSWFAMGITVAFAEDPSRATLRLIAGGAGYGALLYAVNVLHTVGHIAFARLAGAPMAVNVLTSTRDVNVYVRPGPSAPATARVVRALGGPAANLVGGVAALAASRLVAARSVAMFGIFSLAVAAWTLAPVPSLDGWIVWRAVCRRDRAARPATRLR